MSLICNVFEVIVFPQGTGIRNNIHEHWLSGLILPASFRCSFFCCAPVASRDTQTFQANQGVTTEFQKAAQAAAH
jgi:hypothetical protein